MMPSQRTLTLTTLAVVCALALCTRAAAQSPDARPQEPAARNPAGVTFKLRLKNGQTQFRQGEVIRLELAFSSSVPGVYKLDARSYDRSGRLNTDTFHLTPQAGVVDPLEDYYESLEAYMGGGLSSTPTLEAKPYVVPADLNEWFRFDRPGRFRLYVTSPRVYSQRARAGRESFVLTSNVVTFDVLPAEPAWARQRLRAITQTLDAPGQGSARRETCRELRFLNTEAATRELVRRFQGHDECDFDYAFGLYGTPHRALAVAEMERQLGAPAFPVTRAFLNTLARLAFWSQNPPPLPPYPDDTERRKDWEELWHARRAAQAQVVGRYLERLAAGVFGKERAARAVSLATLLDFREDAPRADAAQTNTLAAALAAVFGELPPGEQYELLDYGWAQVAGPAMLPAVRRAYQHPPQSDQRVRGVALRRLYELAPEEGRQLILREIRRPAPGVGIEALGVLPDETLPEVDALVLEELGRALRSDEPDADAPAPYDTDLLAALVERYASAAVLAPVRAAYEERIGRMPCQPQNYLLAYFLRVEPAYGAQLVERALGARAETGCFRMVLTELGKRPLAPELERVLVSALDDKESEIVTQAAQLLGVRGSAGAEAALWQRLTRLHADWHERAEELDDERNMMASPAQTELALARALGTGTNWLADRERLTRLRQLCVGQECRREVEAYLERARPALAVNLDAATGTIISLAVAQYEFASWAALKDKLAQFPPGTTFTWAVFNGDPHTEARAFADLKTYLEPRGLRLVKAPPPAQP
ncbi:MAG TPA: hypothetical protein VF546_11340 [Pyrinomonadaceae bacterium]|jgi:hypothetical protein